MPNTKSTARVRAMQASILAGARHLFLTEGYQRTTMDAVAAAVGASKMTLYRHYRSKEALFTGVMGEMCDTAIADPQLPRVLARLPLRAGLETFAQLSLDTIFAPETLALHRVVVAECRQFPELGRQFYERGPAVSIATLAAYLARNAKRRLPAAESAHLAAEFMSMLRGYEHMRALLGLEAPPRPRERERQIARAVDYVMMKLA